MNSGGIPLPLLSQLSKLIEAHMGLHFPEERWRDLDRKIGSAARELGFPDAAACARRLVSSPLTKEQIKLLASHLTVGETYFFREKHTWQALQEHVLPRLITARGRTDRQLKFWSTACCTGEEPYSLAMVLNQVLSSSRGWHNTILATDINPRFLQKAAAGVYTHWSFRSVPEGIRERYFRRTEDDRFALLPFLTEQVRFTQLNLAEDVYPSLSTSTNAIDVILCRNVLYYFTFERARRVIEHLYHTLVDGGWLIVSPVEAAYVADTPFIPIQFPGVTFFQKNLQHDIPATRSCLSLKASWPEDSRKP